VSAHIVKPQLIARDTLYIKEILGGIRITDYGTGIFRNPNSFRINPNGIR
jgi:hypothetical protein